MMITINLETNIADNARNCLNESDNLYYYISNQLSKAERLKTVFNNIEIECIHYYNGYTILFDIALLENDEYLQDMKFLLDNKDLLHKIVDLCNATIESINDLKIAFPNCEFLCTHNDIFAKFNFTSNTQLEAIPLSMVKITVSDLEDIIRANS